jgi:hypothetical protein
LIQQTASALAGLAAKPSAINSAADRIAVVIPPVSRSHNNKATKKSSIAAAPCQATLAR